MNKSDVSSIQYQIRQNAEDYRNFLGELSEWEKQISEKNKKPLSGSNQAPKKTEPPIRSSGELNADSSKISFIESIPADKELAQIAKETGNHYFKSGKFQKSIQYYTKALDLDPTSPMLYLNRAFSHLKLSQWNNAEEDCTTALSIDTKSVKAYWRRSQARKELGKLTEAKEDLEKALVLEPQNALFREALQTLTPKKKEEKPARRRLEIREIDSEIQIPPIASSSLISSLSTNLSSKSNTHPIPKPSSESKPTPTKSVPSVKSEPFTFPKRSEVQWQPPNAAFEFDRDMKSISDMNVRKEYLKSIPPNKLPSLFKSSIDALQLGTCISILNSLKDSQERPNLIYNYLYFLSQCPRFSVVYTLLECEEKKMLTSLFESLVSSFQENPSALSKVLLLRTNYFDVIYLKKLSLKSFEKTFSTN